MKRLSKWMVLALVFLLTAAVVITVRAQGPTYGDKVIMGGTFTLEAGEVVRGDVVVFGGVANLQADSLVTGDVAVIGGTANIDGHVQGDISVVGGVLRLGPHALIEGDAIEVGGQFERDEQAVIRGDVIHSFEFGKRDIGGIELPFPENIPLPQPEISPEQANPMRSAARIFLYLLTQAITALGWAILMAAFGVLLVILTPKHGQRIRQTAMHSPLASFLVGALTTVLSIPVFSVLLITICLAPLAFLLSMLLLLTALLGWLAIGWEIGERLAGALHLEKLSPLIEIVVGVILLTLLWRLPLAVPVLGTLVGWSVGFVVGSWGLGAAILSRLGTTVYPTPPEPNPLAPLLPDEPSSPRPPQ